MSPIIATKAKEDQDEGIIITSERLETKFEDPFSEEVWRYTYKDHKDETVDDTFWRVANFIASAEELPDLQKLWALRFYDMLSNFKCTAGGRIYSNAGTEWVSAGKTTLFNCFVAPRGDYDIDSMEGILKDVLNQCQTLKSEGGWGQNFSWIRPRGSFIHGIGVETPGAVKYMEIYDKTSDVITAGSGTKSFNKKAKGKIRKGAQMSVLDCWHPDIIEFITAKQQPGRLTKFNVSVNFSDEFMNKILEVSELSEQLSVSEIPDDSHYRHIQNQIEEADKWDLRYPVTTFEKYKAEWDGDIIAWEAKGYPVNIFKTVSVTWLWNLVMESTYNRAEPGVLFLDRANYFNPLNYKEKIFATNPCGEQTLAPGGICCLGSINVTQFVNKDRTGFDMIKIKKYTRYLNRFLDNVNSVSSAPLEEYLYSMRNKRRVGIGILGWGSALFMMKIRFGSKEASKLRDQLISTIAKEAYMSSIDLAEEKGMFSLCEPEKHAKSPFIVGLNLSKDYMEKLLQVGIRNSSLLSCQPTGNTSIFANVVSGGIEPIFMPEYIRTVIENHMPEHIKDLTPKWFEGAWHETEMFKFAKEGDEEILRGVDDHGVVYKIDKNRGLTREVLCEDYGVRFLKSKDEWDSTADWAVTTTNLAVEDHVNDLKGFARWIDSAVSKTVNVPNDYPFDDFKNIYLDAYKSQHVKGITTYRAGTMATVLAAKDEMCADCDDEEIIIEDVKLPAQSPCSLNVIRSDGRKWYLTVVMNEQRSRPVAFFVTTNHYEKEITTHDAVERLIDLASRKGIPQKWIEDVKRKMNSDNNSTRIARCISLNLRHGVLIKNVVAVLSDIEDVYVGTFLFQIRKFLMTFIKDGEKVSNGDCPECYAKDSFVYSEGCIRCSTCSWSKCG